MCCLLVSGRCSLCAVVCKLKLSFLHGVLAVVCCVLRVVCCLSYAGLCPRFDVRCFAVVRCSLLLINV